MQTKQIKHMQVLTGQYPQIYVHKFLISYTDFQPTANRIKDFEFITIPKGYQPIFYRFKLASNFAGGSIGNPVVRIFREGWLPAPDTTTGQFATFNAFGTVSESNNSYSTQLQAITHNVSPAYQINVNLTTATKLYTRLVLGPSGNINSLTAGSFYIWVGVIRLS